MENKLCLETPNNLVVAVALNLLITSTSTEEHFFQTEK